MTGCTLVRGGSKAQFVGGAGAPGSGGFDRPPSELPLPPPPRLPPTPEQFGDAAEVLPPPPPMPAGGEYNPVQLPSTPSQAGAPQQLPPPPLMGGAAPPPPQQQQQQPQQSRGEEQGGRDLVSLLPCLRTPSPLSPPSLSRTSASNTLMVLPVKLAPDEGPGCFNVFPG